VVIAGAEGKFTDAEVIKSGQRLTLDDPVAHGLQQAAFRSQNFHHES